MKKGLFTAMLILLSTLMLSSCVVVEVVYKNLEIINDSEQTVWINEIYADDGDTLSITNVQLEPNSVYLVEYIKFGKYKVCYTVGNENRTKTISLYSNKKFYITDDKKKDNVK